MNILFVNDSSANANWGSRAATSLLKYYIIKAGHRIPYSVPLRSLAQSTWGDSPRKQRFHAFFNRNRPSAKLPARLLDVLLNRSILLLPDVIPQCWRDFDRYAQWLYQGRILPNIQQALSNTDLVFINGEGGIFANRRESRAMLFLAYTAKKYFHKPVVFACHTAELSHATLYTIAEQVYPLLDDVIFRENLSAQQCANFVMGRVVPDITFALKPSPRNAWLELASQRAYFHHFPVHAGEFRPAEPYICVGGSSAFSSTRLKKEACRTLTHLCRRLMDLGQVVLVASAATDEDILLPIADTLGLPLIPVSTSPQQGLDVLANASAYIGGRWHGAIFALLGGTPVVPFAAETFKVQALMDQVGLDAPVVAADRLELHQDEILRRVQDYLEQGTSLRSSLQHRVSVLAKQAEDNVLFPIK